MKDDTIPIEIPGLAGGVSRQPAHLRFPSQVAAAENIIFSVADGASRRPGTRFVSEVSGLGEYANVRVHGIDRDQDEQYRVIYGDGVLKARRVNGLEATINVSAEAQAYLDANGATADQLRLITIADYTFIVNTTVWVGDIATEHYSIERSRPKHRDLLAYTTAKGNKVRTEDDDTAAQAGYYEYDYGTYSFGLINFRTLNNEWKQHDGFWDDTSTNHAPCGFRIGFRRVALTGFTGAAWDATAKTITLPGIGAGLALRSGDMIYITSSGGGAINAWLPIAASTGNSYTVRDPAGLMPVVNNSNTEANDSDGVCRIGIECQAVIDASKTPVSSMHDVAALVQTALRNAGAYNALCAWIPSGTSGAFQITSPWRGNQAKVYPTTDCESALRGANGNLAAANGPFDGAGSYQIINGTGGTATDAEDTTPPESRWTRIAAPNDTEGRLDASTMPVQMKRTKKESGANPAEFSVELATWNDRTSGDAFTNPSPGPFKKIEARGVATAISIANPTQVTSTAHGLATGDRISISGSDSTPSIDGVREVTVVDPNTFTVDVNVSGAGGSARWIKGGVPIADIAYLNSRLELAAGDGVICSAANDLFRFYLRDFANIVDSDPIDVPLASDQATTISFIVPVRKTLAIFTLTGRQFEQSAGEVMTPSSVAITPTTAYDTRNIRPAISGSNLYFIQDVNGTSKVFEYFYDDQQLSTSAGEITAHVAGYIPGGVRSIAGQSNLLTLILSGTDRADLWIYRMFYSGREKEQSAWGKLSFDPSYRIADHMILRGECWILSETALIADVVTPGGTTTIHTTGLHNKTTGNTVTIIDSNTTPSIDGTWTVTVIDPQTFTIATATTDGGSGDIRARVPTGRFTWETMALVPEAPETGWPYAVHLDRRIKSTGVFSAGKTTWTLSIDGRGSTLNKVVLGPAFGADAGKEVPITEYGANYVRASGNYSAGEVYLGRFYTSSLTFTRPYSRDDRGRPNIKDTLMVVTTAIGYLNSGTFTVRSAVPGEMIRDRVFEAGEGTVKEDGTFPTKLGGNANKLNLSLFDSSARPFTITSLHYEVQNHPGTN